MNISESQTQTEDRAQARAALRVGPLKRLRVVATIFLIRLMVLLMRLLGRKATFLPGQIALRVFPDILRYVRLPRTLIGVTGTNGKTTLSNFLVGCFKDRGIPLIENNYGSNTIEGILSAVIARLNWRGESPVDYAVLEIDELSSRRIFPYIEPDYLVVTNLFRDSYHRNAHPDFIFETLNRHIAPRTRLILNGEDPISNRLRPENARVYFAVAPDVGWRSEAEEIVCDLRNCPECGHLLEREPLRYNHIGYYRCPRCGCHNPDADYLLTGAYPEEQQFEIREKDGSCRRYALLSESFVDWYNSLAAIALLRELGWSPEDIAAVWRKQRVIKSRRDIRRLGPLPLDVLLAKALNPVATSRMIDLICRQPGRKAVVLFNTYMLKDGLNNENTGWLYEIDYERLNREDVVQLIIGSRRAYDYKLRLLLAGIPEEKIRLCEDLDVPAEALEIEGVERICVLHDINNMAETERFLARVERKYFGGAER